MALFVMIRTTVFSWALVIFKHLCRTGAVPVAVLLGNLCCRYIKIAEAITSIKLLV